MAKMHKKLVVRHCTRQVGTVAVRWIKNTDLFKMQQKALKLVD